MGDRTLRDRRAARWWHRVEFGVVLGLVVVSAIGLVWSEVHNGPALVELPPHR